MAKDTASVNWTMATDADFRAIITLIEGVFAAGFTRTADTGQTNSGAIAAYTRVQSTVNGYSIFGFNDTLQGTKPVYFKIEYGVGGNLTIFQIYLTVGKGTDGAGNITNIIFARTGIFGTSITSQTGIPLAVSAKQNWFGLDVRTTLNTSTFKLMLERSLNIDGTANGNGIYIAYQNGASTTFKGQYVPFTGTVPPIETVPSTNPPSGQTSGLASDNSIAVFPLYFYDTGRLLPPTKVFVGAFSTNITEGVTSSVEVSGQTQTMLGGQNVSWMVNPIITNYSYLMRYED